MLIFKNKKIKLLFSCPLLKIKKKYKNDNFQFAYINATFMFFNHEWDAWYIFIISENVSIKIKIDNFS